MNKLRTSKAFPWLVWGVSALLGLYMFLLQGTPSVMIPQLMQVYGIDVIKIGVLTSSFFYTYIVMQVPAGMLVDLWGPRRILQIGFALSALAVATFALSQAFWQGQTSRMVMGLTSSPAIVCAFCLGARWFKPTQFTLIVTLTEGLTLMGGIIGEAGLAQAVTSYGWRNTMLGVSIVGIFLVILTYFIICDFPDHAPSSQDKHFREALRKTKDNFLNLILHKEIWLCGVYAGLVFSVFPAFAALWGVPYFMNRYQIPVDKAALLASSFFIGATIGTFTLGWLSVYMTRRRPLLIGGAFLAFLISLVTIYIPHISFALMSVIMLLFGFFSSTYALSFPLVGTYVSPAAKGVAMGFTNMLCIAFGAPILQPLIGFLLRLSTQSTQFNRIKIYTQHDYCLALGVLPLVLFIAFILAFFIKEEVSEYGSAAAQNV